MSDSTKRGKAAQFLLARLDSSRLPGKGLMDLGGRPVLGRAIDRLRRCERVNDLVLATTDRAVDDPLEAFAEAEGIACFRGDAMDVAKRCHDACEAYGLDWFIRICGDSPFADPVIVDGVAAAFDDGKAEIATNVYPRSCPIGVSAEAVSKEAMAKILRATDDLKYREHVTFYAYEHPHLFKIDSVPPDIPGHSDVSVAVDTPQDLENARALIEVLEDPTTAGLSEILTAKEKLT